MNKTMRVLTMAGMGVIAGLAIGAGPAQAADTVSQPVTKTATAQASQSSQASQTKQFPRRDRVVGYYRTRGACEMAGRIGERFNRWNRYDCDYVRRPFGRGVWALEVSRGWNWGGPGIRHNGPFGPGIRHNGPFGPGIHHNGPFGPGIHHNGPFGPRNR
jgi:hypothetical protein